MKDGKEQKKGPKYYVNIEGDICPWERDSITTEEIISLGKWEPDLGAIEINLKDNSERTLAPGEVIPIKPGQGFSKKIKYKRG